MTHDPDHRVSDDTDVHTVERERVVERPVDRGYDDRPYDPPPAAGGSQVNVNARSGYATAQPGPLYWVRRVVSLLFGILAVLLLLRIILLALAANAGNAIVDGIYNGTEPFVAPFRGIFAIDQVSPNGQVVFDIAAVVALIGWLLIYVLIMAILRLGDRERV